MVGGAVSDGPARDTQAAADEVTREHLRPALERAGVADPGRYRLEYDTTELFHIGDDPPAAQADDGPLGVLAGLGLLDVDSEPDVLRRMRPDLHLPPPAG